MNRLLSLLSVCGLVAFVGGCKSEPTSSSAAGEVVIYTSVDQPVAEPILNDFQQQTGIRLRIHTDTEATKSAGLAARLLAEKANPQADVFWGNEVFHTINLARNGVLAPYESDQTRSIPDHFKGEGHLWAGTCLRARVIASAEGSPVSPTHLAELADPRLKDRVAIARPTAGTTGGQVSAIYALWGNNRSDAFFRSLHGNGVKLVGGNSVVAEQVGQGQMLAGLTDNDDVANVRRNGGALAMHLPDQGEGEIGTLTIPCTVSLVANRPASENARKLIDYLLSEAVEKRLIDSGFGQYSVRATGDGQIRTMDVTYEKVAENMAWAPNRAAAIMDGRGP